MLIAIRHGYFQLNERSYLTGEAALRAVEEGILPDADATMDLLPRGYEQGARVQQELSDIAIHACLRSPALRTQTMAEIALARHNLPGGTWVVPDLRERSRGIFSYAPDFWTRTHPDYPAKKSFLDWLPIGIDYNGNPGETIRQVRDTRIGSVLRVVDEVAPRGETVALSTHAELMGSLRAYYLGFDDERFRRPLIPNPPPDNPALATAKMVVNGEVDMYDCTCPEPVPATAPERHMDVFRTIITEPGMVFDTGWLNIREM